MIDRISPYSEYRAVCVAQVHMNWPHASSSKNQTRERVKQPAENQPNPRNGEHPSTTELRSTVQYTTTIEPTKKKTILLHVIPVKISSSEGKSITTYGLLDNDSRGTMIGSNVANELGMKGRKEYYTIMVHPLAIGR